METMSKNRPARIQEIPRLTDDMGQTHPTINTIRDKCKEVDKRDDPDYVLSFADGLNCVGYITQVTLTGDREAAQNALVEFNVATGKYSKELYNDIQDIATSVFTYIAAVRERLPKEKLDSNLEYLLTTLGDYSKKLEYNDSVIKQFKEFSAVEAEMEKRRSKLTRLLAERTKLLAKVNDVEDELTKLAG